MQRVYQITINKCEYTINKGGFWIYDSCDYTTKHVQTCFFPDYSANYIFVNYISWENKSSFNLYTNQ